MSSPRTTPTAACSSRSVHGPAEAPKPLAGGLLGEARPEQRADRRLVLGQRLRADLVDAGLRERPFAERGDRLGRVPLPPRRRDDRVADHHSPALRRPDEADLADHAPVLTTNDQREAPALIAMPEEEIESVVRVRERV